MTLDEELRLSYYKRLAPLNEKHGVFLVQHQKSGRVFVMKRLTTYDIGVFSRLKENPVPGTPRLFDLFESDGALTVIEQYVDGEPLDAVLGRRGVLTEREARDIGGQLASILTGLHGLKPPVIHRDIKPSNLILSEDGRVTLIDLDAAKHYKPNETCDTELIGTQGYAAPEQYGFGASGPETDIYAFGVLLNVLLTGSLPKDKLADGKLRKVIAKCMDIDPSRRYSSAEELLSALDYSASKWFDPSGRKPSKYRPLGFRTLTPWKMLLAVLGYVLLFAAMQTLDHEKLDPKWLFPVRIYAFFASVIMLLFASNFCGVLDLLGISKIRRVWLKVLLIVLFELVLAYLLLLPVLKLVD